MDNMRVLNGPFDIDLHKRTFVDYLEVVVDKFGVIHYATPSHQEKLINMAKEELNVTRDELNDLCPKEYYLDFMTWLMEITNAIPIWNHFHLGLANEKQARALTKLIENELFHGVIKSKKERI